MIEVPTPGGKLLACCNASLRGRTCIELERRGVPCAFCPFCAWVIEPRWAVLPRK